MQQLIDFAGRHLLLVGGFVGVAALMVWNEINQRAQGFKTLTPGAAVAWMNRNEVKVVDISAAADFNKGHILGARNVAPSDFSEPDAALKKLSGKAVLVVCKTGQNAAKAAVSLHKLGAAEVAVLKGGMTQWRSDNYPVTRQ